MKLIKNLFIGLALVLAVAIVVSFVLPKTQHVERSTEIAATAETIYPYLSRPKLFHKWMPWSKLDADMKVEFSGPEEGLGAGMRWQSKQSDVGVGSWTITEVVKNESLKVALDFGDQGVATSFFHLQPQEEKTKITWGFDSDMGMNPVMRWFGLMMDKMVGAQYAQGLATLKTMVEAKQ